MSSDSGTPDKNVIGRIALKQMRSSAPGERSEASSAPNPMNRLVPYLDLFGRLGDDELARLAGVDAHAAATMRRQVVEVDRALGSYVDLLPRLCDEELARLTGASMKTLRFWRLCQPKRLGEAVAEAAFGKRQVVAVPAPVVDDLESHEVPEAELGQPPRADPPRPMDEPLPMFSQDPLAATGVFDAQQIGAIGAAKISGQPFPGFEGKASFPPPVSPEDGPEVELIEPGEFARRR
jgi:hypothetical protein